MDNKGIEEGGGVGRWRRLPLWRKVLRVVWVTLVGLWALTVVQVLLGVVFNPPVTPLMLQRLCQQCADSQRKMRLERHYVSLDDISPNVVTAVVHSEDGLYMCHNGFDVKQMKKAYAENASGRRFRGGSTISQQTAKNAFLPHNRTMFRKAAEAYYTMMIEAIWGKKRIMEVYLNIVEFGDGIYGVEAASRHYFGHPAAKLTRNEAAQLAATLPAPLKRNPGHKSPYFNRRVNDIQRYFSWGMVNLDNKCDERKRKMLGDDSLFDFFIWLIKQH